MLNPNLAAAHLFIGWSDNYWLRSISSYMIQVVHVMSLLFYVFLCLMATGDLFGNTAGINFSRLLFYCLYCMQ